MMSGPFGVSIGPGAVPAGSISNAELENAPALSVKGNATNASATPQDISASANDRLLARVADAVGFTQLTNGMVPANTVGLDKLVDAAAMSVLGAQAAGARTDIPATTNDRLLARIADALAFTQLTNGMVPANTLGIDKLVNATARGVIGATAAGAWAEHTLLAMNIADLSASSNAFLGNMTITPSSGAALTLNPAAGSMLTANITGGSALNINADGTTGSSNWRRYQGNTGGPNIIFGKARGSLASPAVVTSLDQLGSLTWAGHDGTTFQSGFSMVPAVLAATPSSTDMETRVTFNLSPAGSVTLTDFMRWQYATGLSMYGANVVIDSNRILRPRSYTIATLPTITTTGIIHCSDLGPTPGAAGAGLLFSNGTNWVRVHQSGVESIANDAAHTATWNYLTNAPTVRSATALTAARTYTLGTTNVVVGARVRVCRYSTGNFDWSIVGATTSILSKPGDWVEFEYALAGWILVAYNLPRPSGVTTKSTDATHTFTYSRYTDGDHVLGNATLTAARTATLDTVGAQNGDRVSFRREGGGAFDWSIVGNTTTILRVAGDQVLYEFNGTVWNVVSSNLQAVSGVATIATDGAHTATYSVYGGGAHVRGNATLTALRTYTLGTTGAKAGDVVTITRLGTGAFNWDIVGGTTVSLTATKQWVSFRYDGSTWNMSAGGTIP